MRKNVGVKQKFWRKNVCIKNVGIKNVVVKNVGVK